ncbi:hypothetical protein OIN60_20565 [Paenibacillus sp. P96]|uniref:Uncharacterized protein n=1 Tax=Paenibacillus zeirhizosphaerae TaxID=2987519 RepID=A0ABT9FWL9_9BACL|nr:hypothetical protein [Paenibacillus sp. P96]MDP4099118.1 hypothetical protein [Paenibacillus sp. P96]
MSLAPNQSYYADFQMDARIQPGSSAGANFTFNGTPVIGTGTGVSNTGSAVAVSGMSGNAIVTTGATGGTLSVNVTSSPQASLFSSPAVSVYKIA